MVLDRTGRIIRFNRACEQLTGYSFAEVRDKCIWELFVAPEEVPRFHSLFGEICDSTSRTEYESRWITRTGDKRTIAWSAALLAGRQ